MLTSVASPQKAEKQLVLARVARNMAESAGLEQDNATQNSATPNIDHLACYAYVAMQPTHTAVLMTRRPHLYIPSFTKLPPPARGAGRGVRFFPRDLAPAAQIARPPTAETLSLIHISEPTRPY